jgi:hypothetical protein
MSRRSGERRSAGARRWAWIGGIAGALAVSGALVAVLYERGDSESTGSKRLSARSEQTDDRSTGTPDEAAPTEWTHTFPKAYAGPVWITVTSPDSRVRAITITWGPWERRVVHEGTEPVSYLFSKQADSEVPLTVVVEPGAKVTFESGTPPAGAEDINADWVEIGGG